MIIIKLIFGLLLCLIPYLIHLVRDTILYNRGIKPDHVRGAVMVFMLCVIISSCTSIYHLYPVREILPLLFAFHYLFFPYTYNSWVLNAHWAYLGSNFLDRIEKKIPSKVLLLIKISLFVLAVINYL